MSKDLTMEPDVAAAFGRLEEKIDKLPCPIQGERLAKLEQAKENGEKYEDATIKLKGVKFTYDRLVVSVIVGAFGIFEVLKHTGIIK